MQSSTSNLTDEQKIVERTEEILIQNLEKPRCLITNVDNVCAVHHTHVLHRRMRSDLLSRLEYAWGMPWRTLNLDTRYNVFGVDVYLSVLFRKGWWLLLPERRIVQAYLNNRDTPFLDIVNEKSYNYTLVGSSRMRPVVISRYTPSQIPNQKVSAENFLHSFYPFQNLPPTITHVHPRFVICHAGRFLSKTLDFLSFATPENELHRSLMIDIVRLYLKWMQPVPPQSPFYTGKAAEEDKDGDNDSNATPPHRWNPLSRAEIERDAQRARRAQPDDRNRSDDSSEGDDSEYKNSSDEDDDSENTPPRRMNRAQAERYERRRRQVEMYHAREDENQVAENDVANTDARRVRRVMFEPEAEAQSTRQRDVGEGTSASRRQESQDQRVSKRKRSASPVHGHAEPENGDEDNNRMET